MPGSSRMMAPPATTDELQERQMVPPSGSVTRSIECGRLPGSFTYPKKPAACAFHERRFGTYERINSGIAITSARFAAVGR